MVGIQSARAEERLGNRTNRAPGAAALARLRRFGLGERTGEDSDHSLVAGGPDFWRRKEKGAGLDC